MNSNSEQTAKRLLLMTLALEEAVSRDAWHEVDALFMQRDRIIKQLETSSLDARALLVIGEVKSVDDRIAQTLEAGKGAISVELNNGKKCRKAVKAYSQNAAITNLDRAS